MARKKSGGEGGGNTILVVFLVLFILLAIGLGVAFWTGQEAVAKGKKDSEDATKKVNDEKDAKELAELKMKLYKAFLGTATADEVEAVQKPGKHEAELKKEHEALMTAARDKVTASVKEVRAGADGKVIEKEAKPFEFSEQDLVSWPWPAAGTDKVLARSPSPGPLFDRVVKVVAERERMFHESKLAEKTAAGAADQYQAEKAKYAAAAAANKTQVDGQIAKLNDEITKVETEKKTAIDKFEKTGDEARKAVTAKSREVDQLNTLLKDEQDKVASLRRQVEELLAQKADLDQEKRGIFAVNLPHGEIVSRKPGSTSVEINIGSDAGLRPGQTFTIQPSTSRTEGLTRERKKGLDAEGRTVVLDELDSKGTIEVVSVLGPRLSTARITNETDENRNSILKGDLLYNPLFKKNAKDHLVLVGVFDTNADGQDDIQEVARNLAKRGAIVDGYFDLGTGKWESLDPTNRKPGPGVNTTFVVRGWPFDSNVSDGLVKEKTELNARIANAVIEAKTKGAQEVKASKFLADIGYSYSPNISDETTSSAAVKFMKSSTAAPPDTAAPPK